MRYLFCALLLCGCSNDPPVQKVEIEIKSDDPVLKAMGEAALRKAQQDKEDLQWIKQANDEAERLMAEEMAISEAGRAVVDHPAIKAHWDIQAEYKRRKQADGWGSAAKWFVEQVKGKRLADFKPK